MPQTDIGSAVATDLTNAITEYSITGISTDGATGEKEYTYQNANWSTHLGYYKTIPELKIAVDTKANWVLGNGYKADEWTTIILDRIRGYGKDTFNSILENLERVCYIGEDAYAEIIRDDKGIILNLKPLDPSSIVVVHNGKGIIKRYEQTSKNSKAKRVIKKENMFVLSHNRIADEVHGISVVSAVENIILMRNEAMTDWKRVLHRNIDPLWIFHLDTDDTTKISAFKTKMDAARGAGENMYIPKGAVVPELVSTATNAGLNPLNWINQLNDYFFQAVGVPQIIIGNAKEFTDASGKIVYLAFEQRIRGRQTYVEEQVLNQLNVDIELIFPASLNNEVISDTPNMEAEENQMNTGVQEEPIQNVEEPNDQVVEMEGRQ
jgi:hypothetical protein